MDVAEPALSAARKDLLLAVRNDVRHQPAGVAVEDRRAAGNLDAKILAVAAVHLLAAAGDAGLRKELRSEVQALERVLVVVAAKDDVSAAAAVAAVRTTLFHARFAAEAATAVAAPSSAHQHGDAIDKLVRFHGLDGESCGADQARAGDGVTVITLPSFWNLTRPSTRANNVKSRPCPTLTPG